MDRNVRFWKNGDDVNLTLGRALFVLWGISTKFIVYFDSIQEKENIAFLQTNCLLNVILCYNTFEDKDYYVEINKNNNY